MTSVRGPPCDATVDSKSVTAPAQWACKKLKINKNDLLEKNSEFFQYPDEAGNFPTDQMVKLRHENYEKRRRNKMRIVCEYIRLAGNDMHKDDTKPDTSGNRNS